jgi:DNA-binding transcriptional MerR regulator
MVKMYCELMERATVEVGYLAHEAARLVGVPGDRIGQWARWGHIRASISAGEPHVYSFGDVAEALAVHLLLDAGLTLPVIRHAVDRLDGARPLSSGRVHVVDGVLAVERGEGLEDVFTEQRVLELDGRVEVEALLRRGGWPTRLTGVTEVEVDPARAGGRACVRGRRVTVEDAVADPDAYGLAPEQAEAARRWWEASAP